MRRIVSTKTAQRALFAAIPWFALGVVPAGAAEPSPAADSPPEAPVSAAAAEPEGRTWHEQIVVTATRTPTEAGAIPLHARVLLAEEIESAPDVGVLDLLRQDTSVNLARDSGSLVAQPRDQSISFRGVIGSVQSRALPLVDGIPIADPYGSWLTWSLVPKELVERVEIVRGGGSSAWGSLALSGVVNLITRTPSARSLDAAVRLGDRSTQDLNLAYSDAGERWSGWIAGNHFETDGYQLLTPEDRGPVDEEKFRRWDSLHARLGFTASPRTVWTLRSTFYDEHRGLGLPNDREDERELSASATADHLREGRQNWRLQLFHRDREFEGVEDEANLDRTAVVPGAEVVSHPVSATGASASWTAPFGRHRPTIGVDHVAISIERREHVEWDGSRFVSRYDVDGRQRLTGLWVQDQVTLSPRASLQLGARFDWAWSGDATSTRSSLVTGEVTGTDAIADHSETAFSPSAGVVFALSEATRVRGAVYTGFRYASPVELFVGSPAGGSRTTIVPNPELAPEQLIGGEIGVDYTPSGRTALRLTAFRNEVEDLIQRIVVGSVGLAGGVIEPCGALPPRGRCSQFRTVGEIHSTGLEIGADYRPSDSWRWTLDATLMESRIARDRIDPSLEGNQVERAPDQQLAGSVEFRRPRLGAVLLRARYVSDSYDDTENTEYLPSHTLVDLGYSRAIGPRWQLFAGVENLLDERYVNRFASGRREISGPRLWHLGFRFRAGA